ncbi:hypothetical protein BCF33_1639 [Hasllibacter halocynthiae]|uniref:LPS-assembly lipoprotein n=1 Tax=Hasllibacter halocynthiae TaxID=595589 RepID=A0A2T0X1L8_9RHOB|nr:LPS assembly lipoprotein LptE [Hasllibacter halocynthiae]PRY92785.1 hypothetical protein BCF33_1639 [Hasllibacter halocynthiae]
MWSRSALPAILVAAALCVACAPLPPPPPAAATPDAPSDRLGFVFARALADRLDGPGPALSYAIGSQDIALAFTGGRETQRVQIEGTVTWSLEGGPSGRETAFTGYSATGTPVATDAARRDAEDRLMAILAQRVEAALRLDAAPSAPPLAPVVLERPGAAAPPGAAALPGAP